MAIAVRWRLFFNEAKPDSQNPKRYRIDIYDKYTGQLPPAIITLTAGDQPFVTDEDNDKNIFAPVRGQTGTLTVCTKIEPQTAMPNGGILRPEQIVPANNISRYVQLVELAEQAANNRVVWHGFLSCEEYTQDYTNVPQNIQFNVISILKAMESVQLSQSRTSGMMLIHELVYHIITQIDYELSLLTESDSFITHVCYSYESWRFFQKYIDSSVLFEQKEQSTNNASTITVEGINAADALSRICTFMGWTAREHGTELVFQRIGDASGMYRQTTYRFGYSFRQYPYNSLPIVTQNISDQEWMGDNHQFSIAQGAKSVAVTAKMEQFDLDLKLPGFPYGNMTEVKDSTFTDDGSTCRGKTIFNKNLQAYPNISFGFYACSLGWSGGSFTHPTYSGTTTRDDAMQNTVLWGGSQPTAPTSRKAGAFFTYYNIQQGTANDPDTNGLYCSFLPDLTDEDHPIFTMQSDKKFSFSNGKIKIKIDFVRFWGALKAGGSRYSYTSSNAAKYFNFLLAVGNKYYDDVTDIYNPTWSNNRTICYHSAGNNNWEVECDVNTFVSGVVRFELHAGSHSSDSSLLLEALIKSVDVSYEPANGAYENDRKENKYFQLLSAKFKNEASIDTDFASNMDNHPSPSIIMETTTQPMTMMDYSQTAEPDMKRPEQELLTRMASYYAKARTQLKLVIKHPQDQYGSDYYLSQLLLRDIYTSTKYYLPLSESRDWQLDKSTILCFETIN